VRYGFFSYLNYLNKWIKKEEDPSKTENQISVPNKSEDLTAPDLDSQNIN